MASTWHSLKIPDLEQFANTIQKHAVMGDGWLYSEDQAVMEKLKALGFKGFRIQPWTFSTPGGVAPNR